MGGFDPRQYKEMEKEAYSRGAKTFEEYGGAIFEALAVPLLRKAAITAGSHILDVACGIGIPSIPAARLTGPSGMVTGIDIAPGMIEAARQRASTQEVTNVAFEEGDAEALSFPDDRFDVVLSSMGLIHVPDRPKALSEMRRVLKIGGTLALSVWSTPDRSILIGIMARTIAENWPAAVVPGAPSWFDFGAEGVLEKALLDAGFTDVDVERVPFPLTIESGDKYWEMSLGISGKLRSLLAAIPPEAARKIEEEAKKAAERFRSGETLLIPGEELIARALKG